MRSANAHVFIYEGLPLHHRAKGDHGNKAYAMDAHFEQRLFASPLFSNGDVLLHCTHTFSSRPSSIRAY